MIAVASSSASTRYTGRKPKGPVPEKHQRLAVATPTESGVLSCPNSGAGCGLSMAMLHGYGQGGLVRKAGRVTNLTFFTPCPPDARKNANGGFSVSIRSLIPMTTVNTTSTPKTGKSPDFTTLELHQQAINGASMCRHYLTMPSSNLPGAQRQAVKALAAIHKLRIADFGMAANDSTKGA